MPKMPVQAPLVAPAALVQLVGPSFQVPAPPTTVLVGARVEPFQNCRTPTAESIRFTWPAMLV